MSENEILSPVAKVTLLGKPFDVAKNGKYYLVESGGRDAYGKEYFEIMAVPQGGFDQDFCQALLDCLGETLVALRGARDMNHRPE
jgi:hypothetical protein